MRISCFFFINLQKLCMVYIFQEIPLLLYTFSLQVSHLVYMASSGIVRGAPRILIKLLGMRASSIWSALCNAT